MDYCVYICFSVLALTFVSILLPSAAMCAGVGEGGHSAPRPLPGPRQVGSRQEEAPSAQDQQQQGRCWGFCLHVLGVVPSSGVKTVPQRRSKINNDKVGDGGDLAFVSLRL